MKPVTFILILLFSLQASAEKIVYEIYEESSGKLIGKGTREYSKRDVILRPYESGGKKIVQKLVELEKGYKIGARIFRDKKLEGFGLVAQLTEKDFSWEWFNLRDHNIFKKLQGEKGLVKVRVSGLPMTETLEEVGFLDDATLRFHLGGAGNPESHRILVKRGSVLRFD